jgi:hypothetical protein
VPRERGTGWAAATAASKARRRTGSGTRAWPCRTVHSLRVRLFRRQDPRFRDDGQALHARVRTARHGEVIRVRLSKTSEMSAVASGYFVRKMLVGSKSLDQATLEVTTTRGHKVTLAVVEGGELLPVRSWPSDEAPT